MEYFFILITGAFVTIVGWCFWALRCNDLTYKQRNMILKAIWSCPVDRMALYDLFDKVSYKQHAKCLEWCGDWKRLYDPVLLTVLESETRNAA